MPAHSPGPGGSICWSIGSYSKRRRFDPRSGRIPRLQVPSSAGRIGGRGEGQPVTVSQIHLSLSLPTLLPLSLSVNLYKKRMPVCKGWSQSTLGLLMLYFPSTHSGPQRQANSCNPPITPNSGETRVHGSVFQLWWLRHRAGRRVGGGDWPWVTLQPCQGLTDELQRVRVTSDGHPPRWMGQDGRCVSPRKKRCFHLL